MAKVLQYLRANPLLVDNNKLFDLVMEEIDPVRYLMDNDQAYGSPTDAQLRGLAIFMSNNLSEPKNRIPVLQAITGNRKYTSTSLMTFGVISVLIDTLVDVTRVDGVGHDKIETHNEWKPSDWFIDVIPGIEHLISLEGGVCPLSFFRVR